MPPKKRSVHHATIRSTRIQPYEGEEKTQNQEPTPRRPQINTHRKVVPEEDPFERLLDSSNKSSIEKEFHLDFHFDEEGNLVEDRVESDTEGLMHPESVTDTDSDDEPFFGSGSGDPAQNNTYLRKYMEERTKLRRLQNQTKMVMERLSALMTEAQALRGKNNTLAGENRDLQGKLQDLKEENEELELQLQAQGANTASAPRLPAAQQGRNQGALDAQRRAAMRGLFNVGEGDDDDLIYLEGQKKKWFERIKDQLKKISHKYTPFNSDVRTIEARYGSSVAAYFVFFQWVILQYIFLALIFFPYVILHLIALTKNGATFVGLMTFRGILPYFMVYSSYSIDEKGEYGWLLFFYMTFTIGATLRKWVVEDRINKATNIEEEQSAGGKAKYSKLFLCSWDHSLVQPEEVTDLKLSNAQTIVVTLEEEKINALRRKRTNLEVAGLVCRRLAGGLLYLVLQVAGWSAIVFLTLDTSIQNWFENQRGIAWAASSVVPAVVSMINAALPAAIKEIVNFEKWDHMEMVIKQLTVRMYIAKILNAFIQIFSYFLLADPSLMTSNQSFREAVEQQYTAGVYSCRADQVGVGLFQLVATEFVVSKAIALATPYGLQAKAHVLNKPQVKAEFETAKSMVSLLYFAALALASAIFAPTSILLILLFYIANFFFEKHVLYKYKAKPKRPWKAADAGSFFIKFYLATSILSAVCIWYFFYSQTFPKNCSLQDTNVQLCVQGSYQGVDSLCTMDATHGYYDYMSTHCADDYPSCICQGDLACGPFANDTSAWTPLEMEIQNIPVVGYVYIFLRNEVLVVCALVICLLLAFYFRSNSFHVVQDFSEVKDRMWQATVQSLEAKVRKLQKNVDSLQMQMQSDESTTLVQPLNI